MMEESKKALIQAMKELVGQEEGDNPTFSTEEDALTHATRLVALKPGDKVITKAKGSEARFGIYAGPVCEGKAAKVFTFDPESKQLNFGAFPWPNLRIPA